MKYQDISKRTQYFLYMLMVVIIIVGGVINFKVLKALKKNNVITKEVLEANNKALEVNNKALEVNNKALEVNDKALEVNDKALEINDKALEVNDKALEVNDKALDSAGINCELFSEAVGVCKEECTLTSCEFVDTNSFLRFITPEMKVLEIGPYISPFIKGKNVKYFDVMSTEDIKQQVLFNNKEAIKNTEETDLSSLPNIDYVNPNGDMSGIKEKFNIIFSAHNIEHQVNLIRHLEQVSKLLNKGGEFYLIVPDKRYCFDHFIPESSLSDIIDNYYAPSKVHSLQSILAMDCETTHNDAKLHWEGKHGKIKGINYECYNNAIKNFNNAKGGYINSHRWRFTPQQFEFIINELNKMGLISLKIKKVYITQKDTLAFGAVLYKP